mgnify:CR=1 FL=1
MKISKSMFKNLMRCKNFASLLNMHQNRAAHDVTILNDLDSNNLNKILETIETDDLFVELSDDVLDIFDSMFDGITGEDLTNVTSAQLEAFKDTFRDVESLAIKQAEKLFGKKIHASEDTFEQKKFSYSDNGHQFYCYLDGYLEDDDTIRIFEVKATTSKKFEDLVISKRGTKVKPGLKIPMFELRNGIMEYIARDYVGKKIEGHEISLEDVYLKEKAMINPYSACGKYIFDLSIERNFVENSFKQNKDFIPNIKYYLVVLNAEYIFSGKEENGKKIYETDESGNELFKIYDLTFVTDLAQEEVVRKQKNIYQSLDELTYCDDRLSEACEYKKTTQCKFQKVCFRHVIKDGSILEYLGKHYAFKSLELNEKGKKDTIPLWEMINNKCYMIDDCLEYIDKIDNITQYNCYVHNQTYFDKARISYALSQIKYPIYHLDFESYNCPLPRFRGENPYMQSLFQYSLHKEEEPGICDIVKNHTEYLAPDHNDHREDLIVQMIKDIDLSKGGTVLVYNQTFEKTRLKELAYMFPKYKKELDKINDHVFDLYYVIRGNKKMFEGYLEEDNIPSYTYYNNKLHGSFSIKKVLPIFTNLSYKDLEVKNGTEAILTYGLLPTLTPQEYQNKYLALRMYCRQDTWAMVEILRGLRKELEK